MKDEKNKKILVTGGAGFIGSNIVDYLVQNGFKNIIVLDNLVTGNIDNIKTHIDSKTITFLNGDVSDMQTCVNATSDTDIVLHQAALGSVPRSIEQPMNTYQVNVTGFVNMLEAARQNKVKRFVYASSSSVYGDDLALPKVEERVGNPLSPYAVSKKTNELYAKVYNDLYGMEVIGLRYFNVFGPKQNPSGPYAAVIPIFINNLLEKKTCSIFGDGNNRRDFTYVDNVVSANVLAAFSSYPKSQQQIYNVAFGATLSVNDLYKIIEKEIGSELQPVYKPLRPGEIRDSFADISKARQHLGYSPAVSLEEGIRLTIRWYKNNNKS